MLVLEHVKLLDVEKEFSSLSRALELMFTFKANHLSERIIFHCPLIGNLYFLRFTVKLFLF